MHTSLSKTAMVYNTVIKVVGTGASAIVQLLRSPYTYTARANKGQTYTPYHNSISNAKPSPTH
jgi:hypothetical protein